MVDDESGSTLSRRDPAVNDQLEDGHSTTTTNNNDKPVLTSVRQSKLPTRPTHHLYTSTLKPTLADDDLRSVTTFTSKQRAYLLKVGFTTTSEVLFTPLTTLSQRFKLPLHECSGFMEAIVRDRRSKSASWATSRAQNYVADLFTSTPFDDRTVAQRLGLVGPGSSDAQEDEDEDTLRNELWQRETAVLSTGDLGLDTLVGGGFVPGTLTEVAGEASSGKTALSLLLSARVQLPYDEGGLDGCCAYLSSEGNFPSARLVDIADSLLHAESSRMLRPSKRTVQDFTDNVHLLHCPEVENLLHAVRYTLPAMVDRLSGAMSLQPEDIIPSSQYEQDLRTSDASQLPLTISANNFIHPDLATHASPKSKPVKLVVIDSIAAPFRGVESGSHGTSKNDNEGGQPSSKLRFVERQRDLAEIASHLYRLAQKHKLVVILINQVSDVFGRDDERTTHDYTSQPHSDSHLAPMADAEDSEQETRRSGIPLEYRDYSIASRVFSGQDSGLCNKLAGFGLAWSNCINARLMLGRTGERRKCSPTGHHTPEPSSSSAAMASDAQRLGSATESWHDEHDFGLEEVRSASMVFGPFAERGYIEYVLRRQGPVSVSEYIPQPRCSRLKREAIRSKRDDEEEDTNGLEPRDEEEALWEGVGAELHLDSEGWTELESSERPGAR